MKKSCGCIVFNGDKVLVIKQINDDYGFPKGHIETGESEVECAMRETFEEVGINVKIDSDLRFSISYNVSHGVLKEAVYFVSFYLDGDICIQEEELKEAFWVDAVDVCDILTFDNLKNLFILAYGKYREVYYG